jgi:Flp pilus assembly protein CpaB
MFGNRNFVRVRRRTPETIVIQFVLLAGACFICLVGVVAFMHFSSSEGIAATANIPVADEIPSDTVNVIVPIENIQPGTALEPQMFRYDRRPMVIVGPEIVKEVDETKNLFTKGLLVANQPVNRDLLTSLQPINVLTASIPPGYRALSLAVDAVASVTGWAQPGARVDVVWVYNDQVTKRAAVIASNAKVLSANRQTEHSANDGKAKDEIEVPSTVTLLLPHREAMKVRLASKNGQLSLVLRGTVDPGTSTASTGAIRTIDLYSGQRGPEPGEKVFTNVIVKDPKTGTTKKMVFDNGVRVD